MANEYAKKFVPNFVRGIVSLAMVIGLYGGLFRLLGATWNSIGFYAAVSSVPFVAVGAFVSHRIAIGREFHLEDHIWLIRTEFEYEPPPSPDWPIDQDFSEIQSIRESRISSLTAGLAFATVVFVTVATTTYGLMAFMVSGFIGHKIYVARKRRALSTHLLDVAAGRLSELNSDKQVLASIDLSLPISYVYLDKEEGEAIYRVIQGREKVEFLSSTPGADVVASRILGAEWPPQDHARMGA